MLPRGLALLICCLCAFPAWAGSRRLAVVVGNNAGAAELPPLRYAESDAGKVARVFSELGDVAPGDVALLQGRSVADLEAALAQVKARVQALEADPETRTLLLFYFSGHSDGEALELGHELLPYTRLKEMLQATGADVRVVIVDACRSGAALRQKGGQPTEPFAIKLTDSLSTAGEAFITSSAADEAALESSEVRGSIFTHNLVSGLRGAADVSGDRLVTLAEAYRYAHDQTVARTAMLPAGSQHPTYDFQLSGQGELVLTSLARPSGLLVLPPGTERAVVTDVKRDQVIAEVPSSAVREVALPPGPYAVRAFKDGRSFGGRVTVAEGGRREVRWDELNPLSQAELVAAKGEGVQKTAAEAPAPRRLASLTLGVAPAVADLGLAFSSRLAFEPLDTSGLSLALQGGWAGSADALEAGGELRVGYRVVFTAAALWLSLGAEVGPGFFLQDSPALSGQSLAAVVAPRAVARVALWGPLSASLELDGRVLVLWLDGRLQALFRPAGLLGVVVAL